MISQGNRRHLPESGDLFIQLCIGRVLLSQVRQLGFAGTRYLDIRGVYKAPDLIDY